MSLVRDIKWTPTAPQAKAWDFWWDDETIEILFGGGAGGGKSFMGCLLILLSACQYDGTRWLIGRSELTAFKATTLKTFWEVVDFLGLDVGEDIIHNEGKKEIRLSNGSEIIYRDLKHYPSKDPNFDSLGSLEITGAFIDEANQVTQKCKNIVGSRCRYKLEEYGLIPKIIYTCNPAKNWTYREFYKPFKEETLPHGKAFVQALAIDNINVSRLYIEQLKRLPKASRERLLKGNWEFDDDPTILFEYDHLKNLFHTEGKEPAGEYYISCDVARLGVDKTVVCLWKGLHCISIKEYSKQLTTSTVYEIEKLAEEYQVPRNRIIVDEDGVGGGVVDMLRCIGFVNNSSPKRVGRARNYANLKTQCYLELSRYIQSGMVKITSRKYDTQIIEELAVIKQRDVDKDSKIKITRKDEIKESLGRSSDFADAIMMRMWFELGMKPINRGDEARHIVLSVSPENRSKYRNRFGVSDKDESALDKYLKR